MASRRWKAKISEVAGRLIAAASVGGWRVVDQCLASTGTVYLHLRHEVRGKMYLRVSDHAPGRLWFQSLQSVSVVWLHRGFVDAVERYLMAGKVGPCLRRLMGRWLGTV